MWSPDSMRSRVVTCSAKGVPEVPLSLPDWPGKCTWCNRITINDNFPSLPIILAGKGVVVFLFFTFKSFRYVANVFYLKIEVSSYSA